MDKRMMELLTRMDVLLGDIYEQSMAGPQERRVEDCQSLVHAMQEMLTHKADAIAGSVESSGKGMSVDLPGLARYMVDITPTWRSNDIAEIAMQVMMQKWGHWFTSHWHAAGFVAALMPHFYEAGGKVDEMAQEWAGRDIPTNL